MTLGLEPVLNTPEKFGARIRIKIAHWTLGHPRGADRDGRLIKGRRARCRRH